MNVTTSLLLGALSGVVAVLLHQSIAPLGVILGISISIVTLWSIGRVYGLRRYKWIALLGWIVVIFRAATFGSGEELLMQGDGVGTSLLFIGSALLLFTAMRKVGQGQP